MNDIEEQKQYMQKVKEINENNKKPKYTILTMGCQLNENDSEKLCGMLEEMGYEKTENGQEADIALFNTCCVRENAEDKLFGKLGELKRLKEEKGIIIAIGGCMMQEKHRRKRDNYCYWWMHDAGKTYNRQNKAKLSICRYNIWNTYSPKISRGFIQSFN